MTVQILNRNPEALFEQLRTVDYSDMSSSAYVAVGDPLVAASSLIVMTNTLTSGVTVSIDGTNAYMYVPAATTRMYQFGDKGVRMPALTQFYAQADADSLSGLFSIESMYNRMA